MSCLKQNSETTDALKEALAWCVEGKYTQARELARDQYEENARLPEAERIPALVTWYLVSALDAEKTSSLAARYDQDSSRKTLTQAIKALQDPAKAEDTMLVLLAFIRLDQNAEAACKYLKQIKKQLPENAGFGDGIRQLATASVSLRQNADEIALLQGLSKSGPGALRKGYASKESSVAAVAVAAVPAAPSIPAVKVEGDGVGIALIIGISNYDILGPLSNCREDAEAIHEILLARGYAPERVVLLTDDAKTPENRPTYTSIKRRIKQVCDFSTPKDSLVIYFAGHGTSIDGDGYLIPQDGDEKDRENSISITKLQQQMQNSKAGRKLLVLDACHSGSATRGVSGIAPSLKTAGVHVMASCAENELSHPDPDSKHGIFTRYLLEGVDGKADTDKNGSVTQKELFEYVQKSMMEWGLKTGKTQRPQMLSPTTEDIMISRVPGR
ncbi:MAG: caspase family protein [Kiritimatiellales bacterium]